ncbi:MAG TPA: flagellar protein FlaG [Paucimonas sp.]|nr:flagellar protein FlaG [Paucimonas sp.]
MDIQSVGNAAPPGPTASAERSAATEAAAFVARPAAAPTETEAAVQQPAPVPSLAQLNQAVARINKGLQEQAQDLEFTVDTDENRTIVKVVDQQTKEVLRQIPSEEALEIAKALDSAQQGLLIRQKA